jgi:hypothetical protein
LVDLASGVGSHIGQDGGGCEMLPMALGDH